MKRRKVISKRGLDMVEITFRVSTEKLQRFEEMCDQVGIKPESVLNVFMANAHDYSNLPMGGWAAATDFIMLDKPLFKELAQKYQRLFDTSNLRESGTKAINLLMFQDLNR